MTAAASDSESSESEYESASGSSSEGSESEYETETDSESEGEPPEPEAANEPHDEPEPEPQPSQDFQAEPLTKDEAVVILQRLARRRIAHNRVLAVAREVYEKLFDEESGEYYYFNNASGESSWARPALFGRDTVHPRETEAVVTIQKLFRSRAARRRLAQLQADVFEKVYDEHAGAYYYFDKRTGASSWEPPKSLRDPSALEAAASDAAVSKKDDEIRQLQTELETQKRQFRRLRAAKASEVRKLADQESKRDRALAARAKAKRDPNVRVWRPEDVYSWFVDIDLEQFAEKVLEFKLDGGLLIELDTDDFVELGFNSGIAIKKVKKELRKLKMAAHADDSDDSDDYDSDFSDDEAKFGEQGTGGADQQGPSAQELEDREQDAVHLSMVKTFESESREKADDEAIVRVHYKGMLQSGAVFMNSRDDLGDAFEFVLGIGQVITGWDRAIKAMEIGDRARVTMSPQYAYGEAGLPPLVPPNSPVTFDLELISARRRVRWAKRWIQEERLSEKPYIIEDMEAEKAKQAQEAENEEAAGVMRGAKDEY